MGRGGRLAISGVVAGVVGVLAALAIYEVALRKGFGRVLASGEGGMVFVMMAVAGGVFGRTAFGLVSGWLDRRARRRALPEARLRR